ncbi:PAS domain S-box protein [Olleya sp. Ti.3.14]|uniref:sensor histidine kinase n=1 Tax=Olleya sp. Ti.3.14 TaxID=3121297 RepID=UPI00311FC596
MYKESLEDLKSNFLPDVFNHAYHGIAIVGLDGKWIKVNKSICDLFGYTEADLLDLTFQDITHKEDLDIDLDRFDKLKSGVINSYTLPKRYFAKNGSIIWAQLSVSLVRNEKGEPKYFISQIQDVTDLKKVESEKEVFTEVIKEQNERLLNFSRIISHNLGTHAGNLKTLAKFTKNEVPEVKTNESFIYLNEAIANLNETVKHLKSIAESTWFENEDLKPLHLSKYINNAIYSVTALAKNNACQIKNLVIDNVKVVAVEAYLDSIILNLLTNAIKYRDANKQSEVVLSTYVQDDFIVLSVKDNGLGLDMNKYGDKMFSLYQTFHNNKNARGLGLFITKSQVESIGGKIEFKSQVNIGSQFLVYFKTA